MIFPDYRGESRISYPFISFLYRLTKQDSLWVTGKEKKIMRYKREMKGSFPGNYDDIQLKTEGKYFPSYLMRRIVGVWQEAVGQGPKLVTCQRNFSFKDKTCFLLGAKDLLADIRPTILLHSRQWKVREGQKHGTWPWLNRRTLFLKNRAI